MLSEVIVLAFHDHHSGTFSSEGFAGVEAFLLCWLLIFFFLFSEKRYIFFFERMWRSGIGAGGDRLDILISGLIIDGLVSDEFVEFSPLKVLGICFFEIG